jgi:mono/diheme cytochrome c family protein
MKPVNTLRAILLWSAILLAVVMSVLVLAGCGTDDPVMPKPPSGLAADRSVGLVAPIPAPIPHTLDGRQECFACHAIGAVDAPPVPADHSEDVALCTTCHAVWLAPAIAAAAPPAISHELVGREDCLMCHKLGTANAPRVPDNHNGLTSSICDTCHTSFGEIAGAEEGTEIPIAEVPPIPHGLEGFGSCSLCHLEGSPGVPRFPDDHEGRRDDLCAACHSPATGATEEDSATAAETPASDTGDATNGQALYEEGCAICHGPAGEGTAIAPLVLDDATYLAETSDDELTKAIREGVAGRMPPMPNLSDQDILDLLALLRSWE